MKKALFGGCLLWFIVAPLVLAHGGGTLQIASLPSGPFKLSVWTSPNTLIVTKPIHVTVGVASMSADSPVLDAAITVVAMTEKGNIAATATATTAQSTNKLFYETDFMVPETGLYTFQVTVQNASGSGEAIFSTPVEPAPPLWGLLIGLLAGASLTAVGLFRLWQKQSANNTPSRPRRPLNR